MHLRRKKRREKPLEPKQGLNRFVWDMRMLRPPLVPKAIIWGDRHGPKVAPGTYTVRLKRGDTVADGDARGPREPRLAVSPADLKKQAELPRRDCATGSPRRTRPSSRSAT